LLVASRLGDLNFARSVVLLGHHDEDGALGWVLNGKAIAPVGRVLSDAGLVPEGTKPPSGPWHAAPVRIGGPVMPGVAWLLFHKKAGAPLFRGELPLGDDYAVTGDRALIEAVARGEGPERFRLV